VFVYVFFTFVC